jgi:RNA polymerase sigma factor (sigma-70 family)
VQPEEAGEFLRKASRGDQAAWIRLVDEFSPLVGSITRGFRLDAHTQADVAQTVWLRLAEKSSTIRDPERVAGWIARTAWNESLLVSRRSRRTSPAEWVDDTVDPVALSPEEWAVDGDTIERVLGAFGRLSEPCQQLLRLLCQVPPLDYAQIAEIMGRPIGSIGPTRARCLDRLRRELAAAGDADV